MGLFEKQTILFSGSNQVLFHDYQQILRQNRIRFKAYATDNQLQSGCCGLNSGTSFTKTSYTYTIMVKEKEAAAAKVLIQQFTAKYDEIGHDLIELENR